MKTDQSSIDLDQVLSHSVQAARIAGKMLLDNFGKLKSQEIHKKTAFDFVTEVDNASEKTIIDYLNQFYPNHDIHAEESGKHGKESDFLWLIDPLDGTKNYIQSFPIFSISIGLKYLDSILVGVVYAPFFDEMFTAVKGKGAYLNGKQIHVSQKTEMAESMIATGFPHGAKKYLDVYLKCFKELFLQVSAIRRAGSAAIDLAYTACGRFDGFWEFKLNPWDIGAGILLVKEAGGFITDPIGGDNYFNTGDLIAGTPEIHNKMLKILRPISEGKLG